VIPQSPERLRTAAFHSSRASRMGANPGRIGAVPHCADQPTLQSCPSRLTPCQRPHIDVTVRPCRCPICSSRLRA
jgi:hypothetical protein